MNMIVDAERAAAIAKLNDKFRKRGFGFVITPGIQELDELIELIEEIRNYNWFDKYNDIYGEHDSGFTLWFGRKVMWKIDYYDQDLTYGLDPLDRKCRRVLTVMLAHEQ